MKFKQTKHSKRCLHNHGLQHIENAVTLQANALQTLQHPYVCGYKEFFVNWDREVIIYIVNLYKCL